MLHLLFTIVCIVLLLLACCYWGLVAWDWLRGENTPALPGVLTTPPHLRWSAASRLLLFVLCLLSTSAVGHLLDGLTSNRLLWLALTLACAWPLCYGWRWLTGRPWQR